jgi:hypothetical protein
VSISVDFDEIGQMLEDCAKGYRIRLATHSRVVHFNKKVFRALPKYKDIEIGHVRKMVRYLEIDKECVKQHIGGF